MTKDPLQMMLQRREALKVLSGLRATMGQSFITDEQLLEHYNHAKHWSEDCLKDNDSAPMTFFIHGVNGNDPTDRVLLPAAFAAWPPATIHGGTGVAMLSIARKFIQEFPECIPIMVVQVSDDQNDLLVDSCTMDLRRCSSLRTKLKDADGKFTGFTDELEMLYDPAKTQDPKENMNKLVLSFYIAYFRLTQARKK